MGTPDQRVRQRLERRVDVERVAPGVFDPFVATLTSVYVGFLIRAGLASFIFVNAGEIPGEAVDVGLVNDLAGPVGLGRTTSPHRSTGARIAEGNYWGATVIGHAARRMTTWTTEPDATWPRGFSD